MANYLVKMGQQEDIISPMMKQHQSNLSEGFIMLFRVHHIVQQHPDHPEHRYIKTSEELLDVGFEVFMCHWRAQELMADVIHNKLQLHKDSRGRFLSHCGHGVQLVLDGLFDNKPTPVDSEKMFITLFELYAQAVEINYKKAGNRKKVGIVPVVIDCEIVRYHQFIDLNEALAWWESTPINVHDMVPATNSSPSIYARYKLRNLFGRIEVMKKVVLLNRRKQCAICLEEFPLRMEKSLDCIARICFMNIASLTGSKGVPHVRCAEYF